MNLFFDLKFPNCLLLSEGLYKEGQAQKKFKEQTNHSRRQVKKTKMSATVLLMSMITAMVISYSDGQLCKGVYVEPDITQFRYCRNLNAHAIGDLNTPWHSATGLSDSCLPRLEVEEK